MQGVHWRPRQRQARQLRERHIVLWTACSCQRRAKRPQFKTSRPPACRQWRKGVGHDPQRTSRQPTSTEWGGVDYNKADHSLLGLHANAGITFDLAAIRKATGINDCASVPWLAMAGSPCNPVRSFVYWSMENSPRISTPQGCRNRRIQSLRRRTLSCSHFDRRRQRL